MRARILRWLIKLIEGLCSQKPNNFNCDRLEIPIENPKAYAEGKDDQRLSYATASTEDAVGAASFAAGGLYPRYESVLMTDLS